MYKHCISCYMLSLYNAYTNDIGKTKERYRNDCGRVLLDAVFFYLVVQGGEADTQ